MRAFFFLVCCVALSHSKEFTKEQEAEIIEIYKTVCPDKDSAGNKNETERETSVFCKLSAKILEDAGKKKDSSESPATTEAPAATTTLAADSVTTTLNPANQEFDDESPSEDNSTMTKNIQIFKLVCSENKEDKEFPLNCKFMAKVVDNPDNNNKTDCKNAPPENLSDSKNKDNDNSTTTMKTPSSDGSSTTTTTKKPDSESPMNQKPSNQEMEDDPSQNNSTATTTPAHAPDFMVKNGNTKVTYTRVS